MQVEFLDELNRDEAIEFLLLHDDYTLFLLGNLTDYGFKLTDEPYSGNFKVLRDHGKIVGVFCLTKAGNLLMHAPTDVQVFEIVFQACCSESIQLKGVLGEWNLCSSFWEWLKEKKVIVRESFVSKEVLYSVDLRSIQLSGESRARFLTERDYAAWMELNRAYTHEMGFPSHVQNKDLRKLFESKVNKKSIWGLFEGDELISVAEFNARSGDLAQVGGVYTKPHFRNKGFAKAIIKQLMIDARSVHGIRKLVIFTDIMNGSARRVYESWGARLVGHFALLFGDGST